MVNLTHDTVERNVRLGPNLHANGDGEEIVRVEKALMADPVVQAELAKLKLPEGAVVACDPWIYGRSTRCHRVRTQ
jgi:primary-amine oxidase